MLASQADATATGYGYPTVLSIGFAQPLPPMRFAMSVHPSYLSMATTPLVELLNRACCTEKDSTWNSLKNIHLFIF